MEALGILENNTAFIICDEAQVPGAVAFVAGKLHAAELPLLLFATFPGKGFLKLPRMELQPLSARTIREIMRSAASEMGLTL